MLRCLLCVLTRSMHRAVRALHGTGSAGVEAAVNWVVDHDGDTDLDTPLLVPKVCVWGVACVGCGCPATCDPCHVAFTAFVQ